MAALKKENEELVVKVTADTSEMKTALNDMEEHIDRICGKVESIKSFSKESLLKTEFGTKLRECVEDMDNLLIVSPETYWGESFQICQAQWEAFKLALKQFYGVTYAFSRTNSHFGLVNEDDRNDWLFKVERSL